MSVKTQEAKMRTLAELMGHEADYLSGSREYPGPKRTFLNTGRAFLRALAKDLNLTDSKVSVNPAGIAVSGDCTLIGMWEKNGIYIDISDFCGLNDAILYRTVRHMEDYAGGQNRYVSRSEWSGMSYQDLLNRLSALREEDIHERVA